MKRKRVTEAVVGGEGIYDENKSASWRESETEQEEWRERESEETERIARDGQRR